MQKIKVFIVSMVAVFLIAAAGISAQSMQIVDALLDSETADFGNSAYMIAVGSGLADEDASITEAIDLITGNGWNAAQKTADKPITIGELSFIIMQAFNMNGGIMYSLMPSPRYAARELKYLGLVGSGSHPDSSVSGADVIKILSRAIEMQEIR